MDAAPKKKEEVLDEPRPVVVRKEPERDLAVWVAASRPFKRRDREFYVTIMAMGGIVALVLFLVEGFMPVILIVSLFFLFYVLSTVEPEKIEYKVTTKGVKIAEKRIDWSNLGRFWFSKRFDNTLLIIESGSLPGRVELVVLPEKKEEIGKALSAYLVEEEVPPSALDKAANWFSKKLPQ